MQEDWLSKIWERETKKWPNRAASNSITKEKLMNYDTALLGIKALVGEEELTPEELSHLQEYDLKYSIIRYVYMEKMKADGHPMSNFHFTPGDGFMEVPIFDFVQTLLDINEELKNAKPMTFGDSKRHFGNPPNTGQEALDLSIHKSIKIDSVD
jgi:hypothetical protein